jgi:hypothetical protein
MSVLETPRIYFSGQVTWDPITTNNTPNLYDETDAQPVFPKVAKKVAAYRAEAIAGVNGGNWNPDGTHRATFFDALVSGADLGGGVVENDPFAGSPASFKGMLVDLEPYGGYTSQLFFDAMAFGIEGGCRIAAPRQTRFTARYINFARNSAGAIAGVASVVWQTSFAKADGLRIDAFDSPALQALQKALASDDVLGLTVRWNAYRTIYYNYPAATNQELSQSGLSQKLTAKLCGGGFQPNPARSYMVGVIGLWRAGEPVCEPGDRALVNADPNPQAPTVETAFARLAGNTLTLDLSNSISEIDLDLTKNDFGELSVTTVDPKSNKPVTLASFGYGQYNKDAYVKTAGIVTLTADPAAAAIAKTADLQLRNAAGQVLLTETALRAIPLVPNLYMNQSDQQTATFQLYDRGVPAGSGVSVTICVVSADGGTVESTFQVTTVAGGTFSFPASAATAGIVSYIPLPGPDQTPPPGGINTQATTYMYVRVLPADQQIAQLPPTWDNVYSHVLANWHALAPCMDNWLNLGNEAQVIAYASLLLKLTDEAAFENFLFMPVTRDMTPGERTLLTNFLRNPPKPVAAADSLLAAAAPVASVKPLTLAERSRKTRS